MKAVRPYTLKGKILCAIIWGLTSIVHLFKRKAWDKALEFEENPLTMRAKNTLHLWDEVGPDFFGSDIVFANLETPLDPQKNKSFVPEVMLSNMLFNTDEATFDIFSGQGRYKGYDILSIANNHSLDMGKQGLLNTMDFLHQKNIRTVGASPSAEHFNDPVIIEKNGLKVGFIAYTYSLNAFEAPEDKPWLVNLLPLNTTGCDISLIQEQTETCRKAGADIVICSIHAGNAYQVFPGKTTIDLFENIFATCGVDVIVGGHPHNLQPWRHYAFKDPFTSKQKNGFAIYSLADFIAYDIFTWCHLCAYVKLEIGRNETGDICINPIVKPLVMERNNRQLQLKYADKIFAKKELTEEEKDLKILYEQCVPQE